MTTYYGMLRSTSGHDIQVLQARGEAVMDTAELCHSGKDWRQDGCCWLAHDDLMLSTAGTSIAPGRRNQRMSARLLYHLNLLHALLPQLVKEDSWAHYQHGASSPL